VGVATAASGAPSHSRPTAQSAATIAAPATMRAGQPSASKCQRKTSVAASSATKSASAQSWRARDSGGSKRANASMANGGFGQHGHDRNRC